MSRRAPCDNGNTAEFIPMNPNLRNSRVNMVLLLALAGLISASLTIAVEGTYEHASAAWRIAAQIGYREGLVLGALIAAYFVLWEKCRSGWRILALLATAEGAHYLPFRLAYATVSGDGWSVAYPMFACGFTGAVLIVGVSLFLFEQGNDYWRCVKGALIGGMAGGLLAVAGWLAGEVPPYCREILKLLFDPTVGWESFREFFRDLNLDAPRSLSAIRLVFQTGVTITLGLLLKREEQSPSGTARKSAARVVLRVLGLSLAVVAVLLCARVGAYYGWRAVTAGRARWEATRYEKAAKQYIAEAPSTQNLPSVRPMPLEQVLVMENLGGFVMRAPEIMVSAGQAPTRPEQVAQPPRVVYLMEYAPPPFSSISPRPIGVRIEQYPNAQWAQFSANYSHLFDCCREKLNDLSTINVSGNQIRKHTITNLGPELAEYFWSSGNFFVVVTCLARDFNGEVTKRYLQKYPSSLK